MRAIALLTLSITGLPLYSQTPQTEAQTLSTLLTEVQRLRLAIERNTLLGARTQIAILQLQNQQGRTDKLSKDLEDARKEVSRIENERASLGMELKDSETRLLLPGTTNEQRVVLEQQIKALKNAMEQPSPRESQARAREAEIAGQLQSEQSRLAQLQNQIAEMDRVLDVAIRQITGQ